MIFQESGLKVLLIMKELQYPILENYNNEIENKLRGFNTDLDYLKYWVLAQIH